MTQHKSQGKPDASRSQDPQKQKPTRDEQKPMAEDDDVRKPHEREGRPELSPTDSDMGGKERRSTDRSEAAGNALPDRPQKPGASGPATGTAGGKGTKPMDDKDSTITERDTLHIPSKPNRRR